MNWLASTEALTASTTAVRYRFVTSAKGDDTSPNLAAAPSALISGDTIHPFREQWLEIAPARLLHSGLQIVARHDSVGYGKPEAGAFPHTLGCKEGFKDSVDYRTGHAVTGIAYCQSYVYTLMQIWVGLC